MSRTTPLQDALGPWPAGPWDDEPDGWIQRETDGYMLLARRIPGMGHWCGYVTMPQDHPWNDPEAYEATCVVDINVHGGVTYEQVTDGRLQLGFDCAHWMDIIPAYEGHIDRSAEQKAKGRCFYRTLAFVKGECRRLLYQARSAQDWAQASRACRRIP